MNELAKHVEEIGLLLHTSEKKMLQQDFEIEEKNIRLHSLGPTIQRNRMARNHRIHKACRKASGQYDFLLIRGVTPRQMLVHRSCAIPKKAFLLVGSIADSKPGFGLSSLHLYPWLMHRIRMWELHQIAKGSLMLANSPNTVAELKAYFGIESQFAPTNTIRKSDFVPLQFRPFRNKPEILFCGRVVQDKGIEELIIAIELLKNQGLKCSLQVVGKVDTAYQSQLQSLAASHEVTQQIHFQGFVPFGECLLQRYRTADLYVLPSWHEGFPHSIWEAAASCTPIVTTTVGGIPGIISEKEALFVKPKDPACLASGIMKLWKAPEKAQKMSLNAYYLALKHTVEKCTETTVALLSKYAAPRH